MNLATIVDPHPTDSVALVSRGRETTYGELRRQAAGIRSGLTELGLEAGDRVAILCGTNAYFVAAYLGILGAGTVAVPLNPLSPAPELTRELSAVTARAVVVGPSGRASLDGVDRTTVPTLEHVVHAAPAAAGTLTLGELASRPPGPIVERADDDLAVLLFTSGTAGMPRAAMLTHGNLRANLEQLDALPARAQRADDVTLAVLPLYHVFGLNVVLGMSLFVGSRMVLVERFDPLSAAEAVRRHGVTVVSGPPTMWAAWGSLSDLPDDTFASVRLANSGAAKLSGEVAATMRSRFGVVLSEGYGLTEASPVVTSSAGVETRLGSIGVPLPGVEVRLVDADGDDALVGDAGELLARGPNVFTGYWNDTEATRTVLTSDGWLRTGDIAVVDDDGYLYLVDRAKDLIIVSGFNVFPAEVEEVLLEHPAIADAAVIGVAHPHTGEAVKAFVVLEDGQNAEEDELIAFCAERLARYKCPAKVMFVDEVPHGIAGKVLRRALEP